MPYLEKTFEIDIAFVTYLLSSASMKLCVLTVRSSTREKSVLFVTHEAVFNVVINNFLDDGSIRKIS